MRVHFSILPSILSLVILCTTSSAQALAFRCNSYVIDVGMHKMDVMNKCGNPAMADRRIERRRFGAHQHNIAGALPTFVQNTQVHINRGAIEYQREIEIQVEEWVYNFGPQRFMQLLIFEDGRLKQIQDLTYGK